MPGADSSQFTAFKKHAAAAVKPTSERNSQVVPRVTTAGSLTKFLPSLTLKNVSPRQYVPIRVGVPNKKPLLANFYAQGKFYYTAGVYTPGGDYTSIINYLANLYGVLPSAVKLDVTGGSIVITYQITASTSAEPDLELIHSIVGQIALDNPGATGLTFTGDDITGYYTLTTADGETAPVQIFTPATVSSFVGNAGRTVRDGIGSTASFRQTLGLFFNKNDNHIYVADRTAIRKITLDGTVTTFAGNNTEGNQNGKIIATFGPLTTIQGGNPTYWVIDTAQLTSATALQMSALNFLEYTKSVSTANSYYEQNKTQFIAEGGRFPITMVITNYGTNGEDCVEVFTGDLATDVAARTESGSFKQYSTLTIRYGTSTSATFQTIWQVVADSYNNIFVTDTVRIRKITPAGDVTTFAGSDWGYVDGVGGNAKFSLLRGMVIDKNNNLYVGDVAAYAVRKITPDGVVTTFAGVGSSGYQDGPGISAKFVDIHALGIDKDDNIYVSDGPGNNSSSYIRKINPSGNVSTIAGGPISRSVVDGPPSVARFSNPGQIAVDDNYNIYVADYRQNAIRKITPGGFVTTFAGGIPQAYGYKDGLATTARFAGPFAITLDPSGSNLYVGEAPEFNNFSSRIRKISIPLARTPYRKTITVGGGFSYPMGLAIDRSGNLYVAGGGDTTLKKMSFSGSITTIFSSIRGDVSKVATDLAGNIYFTQSNSNIIKKISPSGSITDIQFTNLNTPDAYQFVIDSVGNIYIADRTNNIVSKITPGGNITQIGIGMNFINSGGVALDSFGNLYIGDSEYGITKVTPSGVITNFSTGFSWPHGLAIDSQDNLYVMDENRGTVSKITPGGNRTLIASGIYSLRGIAVDSAGNVYVSDSRNNVIKKIIY